MLLNEDAKKKYGVTEYNSLPSPTYHDEDCQEIPWQYLEKIILEGKQKIVSERVRFLAGPMTYDLSYWHVRIDGERYRVLNSPLEFLQRTGAIRSVVYKAMKGKPFVKNLFETISILY